MISRGLFLAWAAGTVLLAGCGQNSGGHASSGTLSHTTITHPFTTSDISVTGVTIPFTTFTDLDLREIEAGIIQEGNLVYIEGIIVDTGGNPQPGARIEVLTDEGISTGTLLYRNASGAVDPNLILSSTDGGFSIFNAAPGRLNILCMGGGNGNRYVTAQKNEILRCTVTISEEPRLAISHAGTTYDGAGNPEGEVTISNIGQGSPFPAQSSGSGTFDLVSVSGDTTTYYHLSKSGFLDSLTLFETGSSNLSSPAGDLALFHPTEREDTTFKPSSIQVDSSKGIVTGFIRDSGGSLLPGATVEIRDSSGTAQGTVVYSDAAGNANQSLTESTSSGEFSIFNVPTGTNLLLGSTLTLQRGMPVEIMANTITLIPTNFRLQATTSATVSFAGITRNLQGVPQGNITVTVLGGGTAPSNEGGNFTFPALPANSELIFTTSTE